MSWARFDDDAYDHAKLEKAGDVAGMLWFRSILWSRKHRTGGFVPVEILRKLTTAKDPVAVANRLVDAWIKPGGAGLFEVAEGGYQIHDFDDFGPPNRDGSAPEPPRPDVSAKRAEAGRKGAQSRWGVANAEGSDGKPDSNLPSGPDGKRAADPMANAEGLDGNPSRAHADAPAHPRASAPAFPSRPVPSRSKDSLSPAGDVEVERDPFDVLGAVREELDVGRDLYPASEVPDDALGLAAIRIHRTLRRRSDAGTLTREAVAYGRSHRARHPLSTGAAVLAAIERKVGWILGAREQDERVERERRRDVAKQEGPAPDASQRPEETVADRDARRARERAEQDEIERQTQEKYAAGGVR